MRSPPNAATSPAVANTFRCKLPCGSLQDSLTTIRSKPAWFRLRRLGSRFVGVCVARRGVGPAYVPSARVLGLRGTPGDQNVDRSVQVAVNGQATRIATVHALTEGQFGFHPPTLRARFAARKPTVYDVQPRASPGRLVFELSAELAERRIHDGLGEVVVFHHARRVQILNTDLQVGLSEPCVSRRRAGSRRGRGVAPPWPWL